jgi:TorA maturation chaperone TorD
MDQETLKRIGTPEFRESFEELGGYVPDRIDESVVEQLAVEYCALLIGPKGHVSPVQSVWVDNQFQSRTATSMNRFFELLPDYEPKSNLSDHIGSQLDYLGELIARSENGIADEIAGHFITTHLNWTTSFFDRIRDRNESEFYCGLAKVTGSLIQSLQI